MKTAFLLAALWIAAPSFGVPRNLSLQEMMNKSAEVSPEIQAARLRSVASQHRIRIAQSGYLPDVSIEAQDTTGFPGSTGNLGTTGVISSPFRSGAAAEIVATVPIWDFGRTSNAVDAAEHFAKGDEALVEYRRYEVYTTAVRIYYQCGLYHSLRDAWKGLAESAKLVRDEVSRFVKTGQRSIVERYLAQSQFQEAETQCIVFGERMTEQIKEIALLTGLDESAIVCPELPAQDQALSIFHGTAAGNPIITQATEDLAGTRSLLSKAKSDFLPRLVGVADLGVMQDVRLVDRNYYALGAALVLPVFQGFKTSNEVHELAALASSKEKSLEARKLEIADLNARYDKAIKSSELELNHLKEEVALAQQGFAISKTRYFSLQGSVVDVREALRNLSRTQVELYRTLANYLESSAAKAVLNGTPF